MRFGFPAYKTMTDEALVKQLAGGSSKAFDELYARYGQKLFAYFFRMLWKNKSLAEDFTQDVFMKLIQHAERFDTGRSFSTWIYSMAHNMCKNEYRKQQIRGHDEQDTDKQPEISTMPDEIHIDLKAFKNRLDILTETLDEERKALFILRFEDQLTVPEIAAILDIPEGTVKSKLFYMLKDLTHKLKAYHPSQLTK